MKNHIVEVPTISAPIKESPGFAKKILSDYKLDLAALCGFGCRYCSSNHGNYLRIRRKEFADLTERQLGERRLPTEDPELMLVWPEILDHLEQQLLKKGRGFGRGKTLVFSMLTDGFSPYLVNEGITERALRLVLEMSEFRIRILTKNATVGSKQWLDFFKRYPGRFVVGLSTGTLDDGWARNIEMGTSKPTARLRALRKLQDAGVPTYGMLCPIFPDMLAEGLVEALIDEVRPEYVEHMWAEPYNDRINWRHVRDGFTPGSFGYEWMTEVYEQGRKDQWSEYAADLYERISRKARRESWLSKLRFLLYEDLITAKDARRLGEMEGILLQSKPGPDGLSKNPHIAARQ